MTREELNAICAAIRRVKAASNRLDRLKAWLTEQRDASLLSTTRAVYQSILDKLEE